MLDESGLSYALGWYVQGLTERSELDIDLKIPENLKDFLPRWNSSYSVSYRSA